MNKIALLTLLDMLEDLIIDAGDHPPPLTPLPDKWIAASALQKGVRRGNVGLVLRALDTLWNIDPRYARRRLAIIAFEDVGLGASNIVAATVIACSGTKYLPKDKIYRAVRACAIALTESPKERSAEHICTILSYHNDFDLMRDRFAHKKPHELIDIMIDPDRFLLERSTATWYLAGTKRFSGDDMYEVAGDLELFEWATKQLDIPLWQPLVIWRGIRVTQTALPISWPIKLSQKACGDADVTKPNKKIQNDTRHVPPYLLDQFTRGGKAAVRAFLKEDNNLTQWSESKLPRKAWQPTVEMGLFYTSSDVLDQEYVFAGSDKLKRLSTEADCCRAGLQASDVNDLMKLITDSFDQIEGRRSGYIKS